MARGVLTLLVMIALMGSVLGAQQTLGTFETEQTINLIQSCEGSTYSNITKIQNPDSVLLINGDVAMTSVGDTYTYPFSNTTELGQYLVYGHCDESGTDTVWAYDFYVTYTGEKVSLSNTIIIFALLGLAAIFLTISWFFKSEYWILKSFFQFMAVAAGLLAVNSARIIASESNSLGAMGETGILMMIVVMALFFLILFIYAFIEIIKTFKAKRAVRWEY